jgi:hypothetical protein
VAAAMVVLPTPPLPVNNRMRIRRGGYRRGQAPTRVIGLRHG